MAILRKIRVGEPIVISAGTHNQIVDVAEAARRRQKTLGPGTRKLDAETGSFAWVENAGDDHVDQFGILGIDSVMFDPENGEASFTNQVAFSCSTPAAGADAGKFVICQQPIATGSVGRAQVAGVGICKVNMITEGDGFADLVIGNVEYLQSAAIGAAQILWAEEGTGVKWAVVRIGSGGSAGSETRLGLITSRTIKGGVGGDDHTYCGCYLNPPTTPWVTYSWSTSLKKIVGANAELEFIHGRDGNVTYSPRTVASLVAGAVEPYSCEDYAFGEASVVEVLHRWEAISGIPETYPEQYVWQPIGLGLGESVYFTVPI